MKLNEALQSGERYLEAHEISDAKTDAWLLLEYVTGLSRARFLADRGQSMQDEELVRYQALLEKRSSHIPLQHLTGEQEFMGYSFCVNQNVLVPRQDTELLVEETLKRLRAQQEEQRVLDLCTGSGCIAISIAKLCPNVRVDASDLSEAALEVARTNADRLQAEVHFMQGDLFGDSVPEHRYDMIVSNPPYIRTAVIEELSEEVRIHEPFMALDGKEDGLYFYRRIIRDAVTALKSEGVLLLEIGYDQAADVAALMQEAEYKEIEVKKDLAGLDRVVLGITGGSDV